MQVLFAREPAEKQLTDSVCGHAAVSVCFLSMNPKPPSKAEEEKGILFQNNIHAQEQLQFTAQSKLSVLIRREQES